MNPPYRFKDGDYVMNFPVERDGDRTTARDVMKRNGCRSIRFEKLDSGMLISHGYVALLQGSETEGL